MLTKEEALELATRQISEIAEQSHIVLAVLEDDTLDFECGWMFFYQSVEFLRTLNFDHLVGGNAPIIVDKLNGAVLITGSRMDADFYLRKYIQHRNNIDVFYRETAG